MNEAKYDWKKNWDKDWACPEVSLSAAYFFSQLNLTVIKKIISQTCKGKRRVRKIYKTITSVWFCCYTYPGFGTFMLNGQWTWMVAFTATAAHQNAKFCSLTRSRLVIWVTTNLAVWQSALWVSCYCSTCRLFIGQILTLDIYTCNDYSLSF